MGEDGTAEIFCASLNHNISIFGKVWLVLMLLFRVLVFLLAGFPLYSDEQEHFVCNTIQPGCANVCYDTFSPLSLLRFWLLELLLLGLPSVLFLLYVLQKLTAVPQDSILGSVRIRHFPLAYLLHLMLRLLLEAAFRTAHFYLFGFQVPKKFLCQEAPCTTLVDCYVSRPSEKTAILDYMLGVSGLSILLTTTDVICAIWLSVRKRRMRKKMLVEKIFDEEQYYLTPAGHDVDEEAELVLTSSPSCKRRTSRSCPEDVFKTTRVESQLAPVATAESGNSGTQAPADPQEQEGSEAALCLSTPVGTPRPIRVYKHGRLKPPPPPRRVSSTTGRRLGQYSLVQVNASSSQCTSTERAKKSEWV